MFIDYDFEDRADEEFDRFQDGYYYEDDPEIEFDDDDEPDLEAEDYPEGKMV